MRLLISDLYIKCDDLINDANILYNIAIKKKLNNDDIKVVLLFNLVIPDTFNVDINVVALFNLVVPDTFNIPEHQTRKRTS